VGQILGDGRLADQGHAEAMHTGGVELVDLIEIHHQQFGCWHAGAR
jgi:hypothetical protein